MGALDVGAGGVEARAFGEKVASRSVVVLAPRALGTWVVESVSPRRRADGPSTPEEQALAFVVGE